MSRNILMHNHSEYSNFVTKDSTNRIPVMIDYVANVLGSKGFALTDHEYIGNHVKALQAVESLKAKGKIPQDFKIILGNEIYLVDKYDLEERMANKMPVKFFHFILLAKDEIGHKQLQELSSRAWKQGFNYRGLDRRPTFYEDIEDVIDAEPGHIIASTACLGGYLGVKILNEEYDSATSFIEWCYDVFGQDNFYLEMQPHKNDETETATQQEIVNRWIYSTGLPAIITTDSHYLTEADREVHKAYLKSDEDDDVYSSGGREVDSFYATTYFMSDEEIKSHVGYYLPNSYIEQCFDNSISIWERCEEYDLGQHTVIPTIPLPPKWNYNNEVLRYVKQNDYPNIHTMLKSDNSYDKYLMKLAFDGVLERKIPKEEWNETFKRLDLEMYELIGISKAKDAVVSSYFINTHKMLEIFWNEAECMTGCSRGSAAGWVLNYLLQICHQNPLKQPMEMPHWRFISAERPDYPDIDLDLSSHKRDVAFNAVKQYLNSFDSDIVRVGTIKTDKPKAAVQTACRGLGLPTDIGLYLSSLIPQERMQPWSISETYYGTEDKKPVAEFVKEVDKYDGLLETMLGIEGLVCGRGIHACGVIVSDDLINHTAVMRAPNGELITQYDLGDCEYSGLIKMDYLNTKTLGMMQLTFENLIEQGKIEWQGSLRKTYNKYLHPDVLNYNNPDYFEKLNNHELISVFQFESGQGLKALNTIKPHTLLELAAANTLMRLQAEGEQPMDRYVRIKNNPIEFEEEMIEYGLNEEERSILHEHLDSEYGTCSSQEKLMLISMDKRISGFGVKEANILRKAIAKKKANVLSQALDLFYEFGERHGTRKLLLDYIWNVQFAMQFGYAFSQLHTDGYSLIAIQQLELITSYPKIYWETSVLQVEAGVVEVESVNDDEEGREKTTNYGKLGGAIATLQKQGVKFNLPDINKADKGFIADEETGAILYALKAISSINNKTADIIIDNRPYTSMRDFHDRLHLTKQVVTLKDGKTQNKALISKEQMFNLIKAGCFDSLEPNKTRLDLLEEYIHLEYPDKTSLNAANIDNLLSRGLIPDEYNDSLRYYHFRNYLREGVKLNDGELPQHQEDSMYKVTKSKKWYLLDGVDEIDTQEIVETFFEMFPQLQEGKHWYYNEDENYFMNAIWVESGATSKGSFEAVYKANTSDLTRFMRSQDLLDAYNFALFTERKNEEIPGSISSWEMETMCFYYNQHELAHLDRKYYNISNFFEMSEQPEIVDYWEKTDKQTGEVIKIPKFKIHQICGVVLDRNTNKHIVTLLTEYGVVECKYQKGQFTFYDKRLSMIDEETGKNRVVENSWFKRGNLLFIRGIRNGDQFKVKTYKNTIYSHSTAMIEKVYEDGICLCRDERTQIE